MTEKTNLETLASDRCGARQLCGHAMTLVRITPKLASLPELRTFQCAECGHVLTVEMQPK